MQTYVGEIRQVGFNFAPAGWLLCQGQILPASNYPVLFNLLGATYGGDGNSTFGIPNLCGRAPVNVGSQSGQSYALAQMGGAESVTIQPGNLPAHTHTVGASSTDPPANPAANPSGQVFGADDKLKPYQPLGTATTGTMLPAFAPISQPHENRMPYLTINYIIATEGIYPSPGQE